MNYLYVKHENEKDRAGTLLADIVADDILQADKIFQELTGINPSKNMMIGVQIIKDENV